MLFNSISSALLIILQHLAFTNQFAAKSLKYDIPNHKEIVTSPFTIFSEQPEWLPVWILLIMGFTAGICRVSVFVPDMLDLFENTDIVNKSAIIFGKTNFGYRNFAVPGGYIYVSVLD